MKTLVNISPAQWSKAVISEIGRSFLFFPILYYTFGLRDVARFARRQILWYERFFALRLSLKTLFTPLYGDYTKSGRIIGLLVRLGLLVFRGLAFVIILLAIAVSFLLYGVLPLLIIYLIIRIN